jgi:hypothetical protein
MLENLQQSQQLKSILCKGSSIGNESPQPRIVTVDFVNTALGLLQPAFGAISCRVDSEPGKSPKSANHVANSPHSTEEWLLSIYCRDHRAGTLHGRLLLAN